MSSPILVITFFFFNYTENNKHVGFEQEHVGNTLAPSCGITVLEVQQQLRQNLFKVLHVHLVAVLRLRLFQ